MVSVSHDNEGHVLLSMRTHPKALVPAGFGALVVVVGAVAAGLLIPATGVLVWVQLACWVLCGILFLAWVVAPVLRWRSRTFTVTDREVQVRTGFFTRRGTDVPLARITSVDTERGILDRIFGCGTLIIRDAGSVEGLVLADIPNVLQVRSRLSELTESLYNSRQDRPEQEDRQL